MNTIAGLFDHMVLQRNARNVSKAAFAGRCTTEGQLRVHVFRGRTPVRGFKAGVIGEARNGQSKGLLQGLPTGGPFNVHLAVDDHRGNALEKLRQVD